MDWDSIDNIKREKDNRFNREERTPASVKHINNIVDLRIRAGFAISEADFHQVDSSAQNISEDSHIKATLAKVSRWQSFSRTNPR